CLRHGRCQIAVVHRPAEHQPRQPRPDGGEKAHPPVRGSVPEGWDPDHREPGLRRATVQSSLNLEGVLSPWSAAVSAACHHFPFRAGKGKDKGKGGKAAGPAALHGENGPAGTAWNSRRPTSLAPR